MVKINISPSDIVRKHTSFSCVKLAIVMGIKVKMFSVFYVTVVSGLITSCS